MSVNHNILTKNIIHPYSPVFHYCKKYHAEVIFGVTSKKCAGHGICQLFPLNTLREKEFFCHHGITTIYTDELQNILFVIKQSTLTNNTLTRFFNSNEFLVEEDFFIPAHMRIRMNLQRYKIAKGIYMTFSFSDQQLIFFPNK